MEPTSTRNTPRKQTAASEKKTTRSPRSRQPATPAVPEIEDAEEIELDEQATDESSAAKAPPYLEPERSVPNRLIFLVGGLLIALLIALVVFSAVRIGNQNHSTSMRSSALKAADTYGVWLSSYDYRTLDAPNGPWAEVNSHATASFKKDFQSTSTSLRALLIRYHATATGKILNAGVESVSGSKAVVLLFVDQTVTNSAQSPNTTVQPLRVVLTLARHNGHWLIDNLEVPK